MSRDDRTPSRLAMTMADEPQADFGTFLRYAREKCGVSLQELAVTTKISARVLEALERNDPAKLPGGIFSRAFVRAYAREVGLDPDVAVARFVSAFPAEAGADEMPAATSAVEVESFEHRRRLVRALLRVVGVALVAAILALIYYSWPGRKPVAASPAAGPPPVTVSTPEPAPGPPAAQPVPAVDAPAAPVTTVAQSPAASSAKAPLVVVLTTSDACWLSVSVDGTRSPSRTASAGERMEFAVQRYITLTAGNAGAVSLTLNGKPTRALGAPGEVVTATISASSFESFLR